MKREELIEFAKWRDELLIVPDTAEEQVDQFLSLSPTDKGEKITSITTHKFHFCECETPDREAGYDYCHKCNRNVSPERMEKILADINVGSKGEAETDVSFRSFLTSKAIFTWSEIDLIEKLYGEYSALRNPVPDVKMMVDQFEEKDRCIASCKVFTGNERYHHKDCPYYPDSMSRLFDEMKAQLRKVEMPMTSERIKEIQNSTAYPDSVSVQQALLQVWNECCQAKKVEMPDK